MLHYFATVFSRLQIEIDYIIFLKHNLMRPKCYILTWKWLTMTLGVTTDPLVHVDVVIIQKHNQKFSIQTTPLCNNLFPFFYGSNLLFRYFFSRHLGCNFNTFLSKEFWILIFSLFVNMSTRKWKYGIVSLI